MYSLLRLAERRSFPGQLQRTSVLTPNRFSSIFGIGTMQLFVKNLVGQAQSYDVQSSETVRGVKARVQVCLFCPDTQQFLMD